MRASLSENEIEEQNESGDVKLQLDSAFLKLKRIFLDRIEHDPKGFKKALTTFDKHLDRIPKSNDAVLQKALCTFGQDSIAPLKLAKRKNSRLIPVQVKRGLSIHWFAHQTPPHFFGGNYHFLGGNCPCWKDSVCIAFVHLTQHVCMLCQIHKNLCTGQAHAHATILLAMPGFRKHYFFAHFR